MTTTPNINMVDEDDEPCLCSACDEPDGTHWTSARGGMWYCDACWVDVPDEEKEDDEPKKWYAVGVDLDGKYFGTFVVYTTSEEEARDEIADSDIGAPDYDVITLYAYEYEGDVSEYENDKTAYYQVD